MAEDIFDQLRPQGFGMITHTCFVTVNGNEEYDCISFTMTGSNPLRLLLNIGNQVFRKTFEAFKGIYTSDILIDVYVTDTDEEGPYDRAVLRTSLCELVDFLFGMGMMPIAHDLDFLNLDIRAAFRDPEDDLDGMDDGSFDPDEVSQRSKEYRSYFNVPGMG